MLAMLGQIPGNGDHFTRNIECGRHHQLTSLRLHPTRTLYRTSEHSRSYGVDWFEERDRAGLHRQSIQKRSALETVDEPKRNWKRNES